MVTGDFLRRVPLFADADDGVIDDIAARLRRVEAPGGSVVCREGEPGTTFNLVESGTLLVEAEIGSQRRELARMGPGDFFGEIALLGGGTRTATVSALAPAVLWELSADDFASVVTSNPKLKDAVAAAGQARVGRSVAAAFEVRHRSLGDKLAKRGRVTIGRAVDNDIVLPSPAVSAHHAAISSDGAKVTLEDLDSTNGTFVNGRRARRAELQEGDEIWIADERFVFERSGPDGAGAVVDVVRPQGVRIDASGLRKEVKAGVSLLADVSLSILPGEFVAIVGGSGAGKTTLLDALAGTQPASSGRVLYDGEDRYEHDARFRSAIGYVPQDDIVHTELALRRTLQHAARIRLPKDTSEAARDAAVDSVLGNLGLTEQAEVKVGSLSGGQRKRSSIGVELLTQPRVFFLDEPTSGLDPATDAHMMRLLRRLANDGSTVLVTTHATKNVRMCDKVVVLGRGGHLAFVGSPQRALEHFGVETFDEIYDVLEPEGAPVAAASSYRESPEFAQQQSLALSRATVAMAAPGAGRARRRGGVRQFAALSRRNMEIHLRNKDVLIPVIAQPVLLGVLLLALFRSDLFEPGQANATAPLQMMFLLPFNAFLLGLLTAVQEIVKELPIFYRERAVGVGVVPYLLSKTTFLVPGFVLGAGMMMTLLWATNRLPDGGLSMLGPLFVTLALAGLAGMALGLFTSAIAGSSQTATDLLSLWIMPQVLFGGGLFAVPIMDFVGRAVSHVAVVRWAFEASGHAVGLSDVFRRSESLTGQALLEQYGSSFESSFWYQWSILAAFVLVPLVLTVLILRSRQPKR